jgi:hypothetical protein
MKCPKCGFFGPDHLDACKKCGIDLSAERAKLGLVRFRRRSIPSQDAAEKESLPAETLREEPPDPGLQTTKPEAATPPTIPLAREPQEVMQKDLELPQKTVALQSEQLKEPPGEAEDETFQFGAEDDDFHSAPLEKTINMNDLQQDAGPGDDTFDDFEFPDLGESKPPPDVFSGESDDLSTTLAMPDMSEPESASLGPPLTDEEDEGVADDKALVNKELSLGDEDVSLQTDEMLHQESQQKEDTGTVLLKPEEVEDILQSEIPPLDESPGEAAGGKSKTELLGEDELSKLLDDLDTDFSEPDNNP